MRRCRFGTRDQSQRGTIVDFGGATERAAAFGARRGAQAQRMHPLVVGVLAVLVDAARSRGATHAVVGAEIAAFTIGRSRALTTTVAVAVVRQHGIGGEVGTGQTGRTASLVLRRKEPAAPIVLDHVSAAIALAAEASRVAVGVDRTRRSAARFGAFERWCLCRYAAGDDHR